MPIAEPTKKRNRAELRANRARARAVAAKQRREEAQRNAEDRRNEERAEKIGSSTRRVAQRERTSLPGDQSLGYAAGRPYSIVDLQRVQREEEAKRARRRAELRREMIGNQDPKAAGMFGSDDPLELLGNLGSDVQTTAEGIGPALLMTGRAALADVAPGAAKLLGDEAEKPGLFEEVVKPLGEQYRYTYLDRGPVILREDEQGPVYRARTGGETRDVSKAKRGVRSKLAEHPLGPLLDAAAIVTAGGAVAGKAGQLGMLGERGLTLRDPGRMGLTTGAGEKIIDKATSRNPATRAMQRGFRALTTRIVPRETPFLGEEARAARVGARQTRRAQDAEASAVVREFDRTLGKLSGKQKIAVALRGRGARPSEEVRAISELRQADYATMTRLRAKPQKNAADRVEIRRLRKVVGDHDSLLKTIGRVPDSLYDEVLTDPKMLAAYEQGERVTQAGGDVLESVKMLDPEDRALRLYLHARVRSGASYKTYSVAEELERGGLKSESLTGSYVRASDNVPEYGNNIGRIESVNGSVATVRFVNRSKGTSADATIPLGQLQRTKAHGEFVGGTPVEVLKRELTDLIYSPDVGATLREGTRPLKRSGARRLRKPGLAKQNKAIRLMTSRWLPDPRAWRDSFVKSIAYAHAIQRGQFAWDKFGRQIGAEGQIGQGGYFILNPRAWMEGKGPTTIARADRERGATRDRQAELLDDAISDEDILRGIDKHVATDDAAAAGKWTDEFGDENVRWISKHEYQELFGDFQPVNAFVRNVLDRPTDFWRKLTLNYRPAWFVNNFVGQHLLYAMNHATPGGARAYAAAIAERDRMPEQLRASGLYRAEQSQSGGFRQAHNGFDKMSEAIGEFNTKLTDELPRRAAWRANAAKAKPHIDRIEGINRTLGEFLDQLQAAGAGKLDNALLKEQHDLLVQQVLDELIDFGNLSRGERAYIRRVLPFYSWMKGITLATSRMAFHNPAKTALMVAISNEGEEAFKEWFGEGFDVLRNQFGVSKDGDVATTLSTQGLNPFQTISDNAKFVKGLLGAAGEGKLYDKLLQGDFAGAQNVLAERELGFGSENPANAFGPVIQGGIEATTGRDVFTQQQVPTGFPGFIQSFVRSFPQERLAETLLNPADAKTKEGEPRLTQPGGLLGVPDAVWNYLGLPIKHKSLSGAARVVEDQRLLKMSDHDRIVFRMNKTFDKKLRENRADAKKYRTDYNQSGILDQTIVQDLRVQHRVAVAVELAKAELGVEKLPSATKVKVMVATLSAEKKLDAAARTYVAEEMKKANGNEALIESLIRKIESYAYKTYYRWRDGVAEARREQ